LHVGTIARGVGQPHDQGPWQWLCGFYPGSHPREQTGGTAPDFDQARADFEAAWQKFSARRTEAAHQPRREQRDWTAEKYCRFDRGEPMPPNGRLAHG
jgi:hypothetical protein